MVPPSSSPPPLPNSPREDTPIAKLLNSLPIEGLKLGAKQKRLALFGCGGAAAFMMLMCGGLFVVGFVAAQQETERVRKELPVAHALWQGGQKQEAIAKYRTLLENSVAFMEKAERELIFERTITFDAERGNVESAKKLLDRAKGYRVEITSESQITQGLIARWEQEEKRIAAEERRKKQLADQRSATSETSPPKATKPKGYLSLVGWFSGDELLDFLDNPSKYEGYEITIDAQYDGKGLADWIENGKFASNVSSPFSVGENVDGRWIRADLKILIPRGCDVTPIRQFEDARIKFICSRGSLTSGNRAVSVQRP